MINIILYMILNILFFFLSANFLSADNRGYSPNKQTSVVEHELKKIDLIYYDRFPYKKSYDGIKIPECSRVNVNKRKKSSGFLLCREYITLLRPASVIKLWQQQQRTKGYLPFSMKEFGIINVHAHITGVNEYTPVIKNNITSDSIHVTGKFIRYTPEVNHYRIKDRKTNIISFINATPNHPFYVINEHKFIPISMILSSDSLVTLSNHQAYLVHQNNNNHSYGINDKKNTLSRVYNIEIEKKHVYFISKLNILVHNPCINVTDFHRHLEEHGLIQQHYTGDTLTGTYIRVIKSNLWLLDWEGGSALTDSGNIKPEILHNIHKLRFSILANKGLRTLEDERNFNVTACRADELFVWKLSEEPATTGEHKAGFSTRIPYSDSKPQPEPQDLSLFSPLPLPYSSDPLPPNYSFVDIHHSGGWLNAACIDEAPAEWSTELNRHISGIWINAARTNKTSAKYSTE